MEDEIDNLLEKAEYHAKLAERFAKISIGFSVFTLIMILVKFVLILRGVI